MPETTRARRRLFDLALWLLLCVPVLLRSDPNDGGSWLQVAAGVTLLGGCVAVSRRLPLLPLAATVPNSQSEPRVWAWRRPAR